MAIQTTKVPAASQPQAPAADKSIPTRFNSETDLKKTLAFAYQAQITNFLGNEKRALKFLSGVMAAVQRNPKLLECTGLSVVNAFVTMAQLELMPSDVSGEAYVIPYSNNRNIDGKWVKVMETQFQLGYQGLVTLFYRAGVKKIVAEIVYENDAFEYVNGEVTHKPDVFAKDRGAPKGAYCIVTLHSGEIVSKVMSSFDILDIAKKFSKSYASGKGSPWDQANDPQLWMWRKTVLKQAAKLIPKSDKLIEAIEEDNRDSIIADRLEPAMEDAKTLTMGAIAKTPNDEHHVDKNEEGAGEEAGADQDQPQASKGDAPAAGDGKLGI